jgi:hypothetical protein
MNTAQIIVQSVPMREAAMRYGYRPNKAGFIKCPFHAEKTASLKIYPENRGWHCFGCGRGGDVIDFVKFVHGVDFKQALSILNADFGLCLPEQNNLSYRDRERLRVRTMEARHNQLEQDKAEAKKESEYESLLNEYIRLDIIRQYLQPEAPGDELCSAYVFAMHRLPVIEYMLDTWG